MLFINLLWECHYRSTLVIKKNKKTMKILIFIQLISCFLIKKSINEINEILNICFNNYYESNYLVNQK